MKYKKISAIIIAVLLFCVLGYYIIQAAVVVSIDESKSYPVVYVLDGDTFKVKIGSHIVTVRMLGIDTPETVNKQRPVQCYGKEASDKTKELLIGKKVQLKLNPNREEKDRYGRYLAYAYVVGNDSVDATKNNSEIFVNEFLLQNGYAREYTYGKPYMYQKQFRQAEDDAKNEKKGLWSTCINE